MTSNNDHSLLKIIRREDWGYSSSPARGVKQSMLDQHVSEKHNYATAIIRLQPGRKLSINPIDGGEEYLVLDGKVADDCCKYGEGFYVRNLVASRQMSAGDAGALVFLKRGQIDPADKTFVRLDTQGADWQSRPAEGLKTLQLHRFEETCSQLVTLRPGCTYPHSSFPDGAEILIIDGALEAAGAQLQKGDWMQSPAGTDLTISSKAGATFYIKTGHLKAQ